MRLKSLKLAGFKSFANPTTFTFRHGICAIVGPNGCGKSNVIDAIRWVLGESSAKQLRGGAMSDVIFAGTQDKVAKSLASVELTFEHTQDELTGIRHELNLYHELSVRRQVNIEGKSDYFINGTKCRRRDVVDVFLGTGLGPRSYSVIQQGMIGRIVDSSPLQLREFIEEAAGVSRYQARREETQKKLAKTRENLDRLRDIESELTKQKKKLAKQAQSANEYQKVVDDLSHAKEELTIAQLYQAKSVQMKYKAKHKELSADVEALQASSGKVKKQLNRLNERMAQEQWLKDQARDKLHEQDLQKQKTEHQLATIADQINQLERRLRANKEKQTQTKDSILDFKTQAENQADIISTLTPQLEALQKLKEEYAKQSAPMQKQWEQVVSHVADLETQKRNVEQTLALEQQAINRLNSDLNKWQSKHQAWQLEAEKWHFQTIQDANLQDASFKGNSLENDKIEGNSLDERLENSARIESSLVFDKLALDKSALEEKVKTLDLELKSLSNQQDDIADRQDMEQPQLERIHDQLTQNQKQYTQLEKRHATLMGEYDTLHGIVHRSKPVVKDQKGLGVKITQDVENAVVKFDHLPTLDATIELTKTGKQYAEQLDQWLSFWLNSRVLNCKDANSNNSEWTDLLSNLTMQADVLKAKKALSDKQSKVKKATDDSDLNGNTDSMFLADLSDNKVNSDEVFKYSQSFIEQINSQLDTPRVQSLAMLIAKPSLNIWQHCYLYDDSASATEDGYLAESLSQPFIQLLNKLPNGALVLTHSGWIVSQNLVLHLTKLTGNVQNEHFLSARIQQQERLAFLEASLSAVEGEMEALDKTIKSNKLDYERLKVINEELSAQLHTLTHRQHELKQQRFEAVSKLEEWQREHTRLLKLREQLDAELLELKEEQKVLLKKKASSQQKRDELTPKLERAQVTKNELEQQRHSLNKKEREGSDAYAQLQLESNKAQLATSHINEQLMQLKSTLEQLVQSHKNLSQELDSAYSRQPALEKGLKVQTNDAHALKVALEEHNGIINNLKTEMTTLQRQQSAEEERLNHSQAQLAEYATKIAVANERIQETSERLQALSDDINPSAILTDFVVHNREVSQDKLKELQNKEHALTAKLNEMGPVNLAAASELDKVDERLLPLEKQISDITGSMDKLVDAIASIDGTTKSLFLETLESVNESLTALFTKVFGGGQASLTLVKDDTLDKSEGWRAGLELMAQPKGKKNSRLAVLSGGEKTLTALSLIFAIFKQHPAPFCVLDEVDAPLDDANVARFTHLIKELAHDVQFIFISHNKLAMQIADELKGITMPQAGISSLVSVSLEEAEKYLEPTA